MNARIMAVAGLAAILLAVGAGAADIAIATVPVGDAGNTGEWSGASHGGSGSDRICGAVDYEYNIGKYEVTAGQYTEFLNAVVVTRHETMVVHVSRRLRTRFGGRGDLRTELSCPASSQVFVCYIAGHVGGVLICLDCSR